MQQFYRQIAKRSSFEVVLSNEVFIFRVLLDLPSIFAQKNYKKCKTYFAGVQKSTQLSYIFSRFNIHFFCQCIHLEFILCNLKASIIFTAKSFLNVMSTVTFKRLLTLIFVVSTLKPLSLRLILRRFVCLSFFNTALPYLFFLRFLVFKNKKIGKDPQLDWCWMGGKH